MALKKPELYSSLWQSCDALRGGMDTSQYKDYARVLLFIKYVSDKYAGQAFAPIQIPDGMRRNLTSMSSIVPGYSRDQIGQQSADQMRGSQHRTPNLEPMGFTWN
jgi:type I restriction enzyme M protein